MNWPSPEPRVPNTSQSPWTVQRAVIIVVRNDQATLSVNRNPHRPVEGAGLGFAETAETADVFDLDLRLGEGEGGAQRAEDECRQGDRCSGARFFQHNDALLFLPSGW